jgi:hypothetical protein
MFYKSYLGHDFPEDLIYFSVYHGQLITCLKCKMTARLDKQTDYCCYYYGGGYYTPLISCDEYIIKNIIE